jgi:hypothetical protein
MYQFRGGTPETVLVHMLSMLIIAILGGMVGLVLYELVEEVRGGSHELHDRYHE